MKKNIVLVSNTCSMDYFVKLQAIKRSEKLAPSQKYFHMLLQGLADIEECELTCLTIRAIDPSNCDVKSLKAFEEVENSIKYIYPKVICKKVIKNVFNFISGFKYSRKIIKQDKKRRVKTIFVYDPLCYDVSYGSLLATKKHHRCGLVTDLPNELAAINKSNKKKKGFLEKLKLLLMNSLFKKFDSFCFLTESMNVINKKAKPYTIIEGMVYANYFEKQESVDNNIVLYAGGLYEKFGIKSLVDAATQIDIPGFELHLYGEGNLVEYINYINNTHPDIKYLGAVGLKEIFEKEKQAKVLINPRPSDENFTKFSFPSKTLEYMSTGRPVLTTPLLGIPSAYFDYLFIIDDESCLGIKKAIENVLSKSDEELDEVGRKSMRFAYEEKNNKEQAKKIWKLLIALEK